MCIFSLNHLQIYEIRFLKLSFCLHIFAIPKSLNVGKSLAEFWTNCGNKNAAINICIQLGKSPSSPTKAKGFELFLYSFYSKTFTINSMGPPPDTAKNYPTKNIGQLFCKLLLLLSVNSYHSKRGGCLDVQKKMLRKKS